jgi:hypothetical protein
MGSSALQMGRADRQNGTEESNSTTTVPSEDPRTTKEGKGFWLRFFPLFTFFFYSSDAFGLGREGLGRQIYPWVLRLLFLIFGLLFWRLNCYIHTRRKTNFYNPCVAFDFFCVTYSMAGFSLSLTLTAAGQSTVITYLTTSQMEKRV